MFSASSPTKNSPAVGGQPSNFIGRHDTGTGTTPSGRSGLAALSLEDSRLTPWFGGSGLSCSSHSFAWFLHVESAVPVLGRRHTNDLARVFHLDVDDVSRGNCIGRFEH